LYAAKNWKEKPKSKEIICSPKKMSVVEFIMDEDLIMPEVPQGMQELLDGRNNDGKTPLHLASQQGHLGVIEILISYGADLHILDNDGKTAQDLAAQNGHNHVVEYFAALSRDGLVGLE
jgi:ankyrin repeat protein